MFLLGTIRQTRLCKLQTLLMKGQMAVGKSQRLEIFFSRYSASDRIRNDNETVKFRMDGEWLDYLQFPPSQGPPSLVASLPDSVQAAVVDLVPDPPDPLAHPPDPLKLASQGCHPGL